MAQFTASEVRERERFEDWYTTHTFNYSRDPIGSRDCSLQWESWKAALATRPAQAQPPAASVPEMTGLTWEPPNVTVDVERVGRFRSGDEHIVIVTFRSSDDGRRMTCFYSANKSAAEYLHAMLAAQENPNG